MSSKQLTVDIEKFELLAKQVDGLEAEHELMIAEFEKEREAFRKTINMLNNEEAIKRQIIRELRQKIDSLEYTIMSKDEEIHARSRK